MGTEEDDLFTDTQCLLLVCSWLCIWIAAHHLAWFVWQRGRVPFWHMSALGRYQRRLCRSQVYCAIACVGSVDLLGQCGWNASDLLHKFSAEHQIFFTMAVAHWLLSIWEDAQCASFLGAGMSQDLAGVDPSFILAKAYLVHHAVACLGFYLITYLRSCTGIGVFGLLYELPVLLMNHREFAVCREPRPAWMHDLSDLKRLWELLRILFIVGRGIPSAVYLYSVIFWRDELLKLPYAEAAVYHVMAVFFTVLNFHLMDILGLWKQSDFLEPNRTIEARLRAQACIDGSQQLASDAEVGGADDSDGEGDVANGEVVNVSPMMYIREEHFYRDKGAQYEPGVVLVEVDGIVYDVSKFIGVHPGGAETLQRFAGRDATEAFHRVRHSSKAKVKMQKMTVGAVYRRLPKYRIFEEERMSSVVRDVGMFTLRTLLTAWLLPRSKWGCQGEILPNSGTWGAICAPGLCLCSVLGGLALSLRILAAPTTLLQTTRNAHLMGFAWALLSVGFFCIRRPLPPEAPDMMPTGVELGAVGLFFAEELREWASGAPHWSRQVCIAAAFEGVGLLFRGVGALPSVAPEHLVGAFLLVCSLSLFSHVRRMAAGSTRESFQEDLSMSLSFATIYSALALFVGSLCSPDVGATVFVLWNSSYYSLAWSAPAAWAAWSLSKQLIGYIWMYSPSFVVRTLANILGASAFLAGGFSHWYWCSFVAWWVNNTAVAIRHRRRHDDAEAAGRLWEVPEWELGLRCLWDTVRAMVLSLPWNALCIPTEMLVNFILPRELRVMGLSTPVPELGEKVDYGVAVYTAPAQSQHYRGAPQFFECRTRHVDETASEDGAAALQRAWNTTGEAWRAYRELDVKGLVANIVCFFPNLGGSEMSKEVQIACWQSSADAAALHARRRRRSEARRDAGGHAEGPVAAGLASGGDVAMQLRPRCEVKHQDRCKMCHRLLESSRAGVRAPGKCRACGGKGHGYAFF
mmetsp:Transcript_119522/g.381381  ORF Transcript_119522/g.381381 Transcript_119522/m.381381 type:complete len:971 (-) Transcript_119522:34-2946(-)